MNLESLPFLLGVVATVSFCAAAALYFVIRARPFGALWRGRSQNQTKATEIQNALEVKRVVSAYSSDPSSLMKILERGADKAQAVQEMTSARPKLPPPPTRRAAGFSSPEGNALETVIVQMYEEYLSEIAAFQKELSDATSVGEILNKTCRNLSALARQTRVVYLEYQSASRALMVASRSSPEVFAGTQPKMFLALQGAGKSVSIEELRSIFVHLSRDNELQRLLMDSCLIESRSEAEANPERLWSAQTAWRIFPLYVRGRPQGAFAVQENSLCQRREFVNLVGIFLAQAASAVENIRLHSKLVDVAAKDPITGLQTRKIFQERLQENFLIARRLRHPLTVLRIEVDHMPAYVKQYGSSVAEAILRHVTRHLARNFRKSDIMARFGPEGFAVMMPHTAVVDALKKVEHVVQQICESSLRIGRQETAIEVKISASAGLAEFPSHVDNPDDLLRFANEALFRGQGRERAGVTLAKVPTGYVPPFNSRFVRSSPKSLSEGLAG
jgi:diguanylate cyclase (GGDEF)-like protein